MGLHTAKLGDLESLWRFVQQQPGMPVALSCSYVWENVQPGYFISTLFTQSESNYKNVLYHFSSDGDHIFEEWSVDPAERDDLYANLLDMFPGGVAINLSDRQYGEGRNWEFVCKRREMVLDTSRWVPGVSSGFVADLSLSDQITTLMAQEWWTPSQAEQFVNVTMGNPTGVSVVVAEHGIVVGFAHAACDELVAWINAVYVADDCRGRGVGKDVVSSLITTVKKRGVKRVGLGVGEDEHGAVALYSRFGFSFSEFERWRYRAR